MDLNSVAPTSDCGYTNEGFLYDDVVERLEIQTMQEGDRRYSGSVLAVTELSVNVYLVKLDGISK